MVVNETKSSKPRRDKGRYSIEQAYAKLNGMVIQCSGQEYCCGASHASPKLSPRPELMRRARVDTPNVGRKGVTLPKFSTQDRPDFPVFY